MHDLLYQHQADFSEALFPKLAKKLALDPEVLTAALTAGKYSKTIEAEIASGDKAGVQGTPSFFLDGKLYEDAVDYETLLSALA